MPAHDANDNYHYGYVAEGRSQVEVAEIAQDVAGKIAESCRDHGDPLPPALVGWSTSQPLDLAVPKGIG